MRPETEAAGPGSDRRGDVLGVVITYNSASFIQPCLQAAQVAGLHNLVVWDNGSADATVELAIAAIGSDRVLRSVENLGFGRAINEAISATGWSGDVLLLNPDCLISEEVLQSLLRCLARQEDVGIVAPAMMLPSGQRSTSGGAFPTLTKEALAWLHADRLLPPGLQSRIINLLRNLHVANNLTSYAESATSRTVIDLDWVSGFCMLIREQAWRDTGGFDSRFFLYFEDVALCHAAMSNAWRVVMDGRVAALHDESSSTKHNFKSRHYYVGMWTFFQHFGSPAQRLAARTRRALSRS